MGLQINSLSSGGLITNYYCSSKCAHCLYACSPKWKKEYIERQAAVRAMEKIKSLGCYSIHIGGGEPLLDPEGLLEVADAAREICMGIDYVETNSSWYRDEARAVAILRRLKARGVYQLLVSISPFHNEHIPFYKVKGVLQACRKSGMQVFPWVMDFYEDIDAFPDHETHALEEYAETWGEEYLRRIPMRYWTHFGGRAIKTFAGILPLRTLAEITSSPPCRELADTSHFHIDLFGNYIPGLCSGFGIDAEDLGGFIPEDKYPFIHLLYTEGIGAFLVRAQKAYGFEPASHYLNKCDLCNAIRRHMVRESLYTGEELKPLSYYEETA